MIKETAIKYHSFGLSVIPVGSDKLPRIYDGYQYEYAWKKHQTELILPNGIFDKAYGLAIVCGKVSDGLECLDIDLKYDLTGNLYKELKETVNSADTNLLKKMVVEKSPSGGYHFFYKCSEVGGNTKLANRYVTEAEKLLNPKEKEKVLIETRGEGGYFACYPTKGYELVYGSFDKINEITPQERDILLTASKSFNQVFEKPYVKKEHQAVISGNLSPFEDWNERGDVLDLLQQEGWKVTFNRGSKHLLLRPAGTGKWSADWDDQKRLFYVWTSSSEFENSRAYNPSQVLAILKFNKDYSACAKWLKENGYGDNPEHKAEIKKVKSEIKLDDDNFDFIAKKEDIDLYLHQWRTGTFVKGVTTGIKGLDEYFLFKRGNFNMINGKDNVGKSVFMWYLLLLSSLYHDWNWVIYSNENRAGTVVKRMIEFYWGQWITQISDSQYLQAKTFIDKHFTIISNDHFFNFKDLLNICKKLLLKKKYDGMLIDPYNSLKIDLSETSKLNTHEYHYEAASEMQTFTKANDCCIYLNCHVVTSAARENTAPQKAHTEGGAKFPNKADDFLTLHRYPHTDQWRIMEIHTRKIKETETGGSYTKEDKPFKLRMLDGNCSYVDENNVNPIAEYWRQQGKQSEMFVEPKSAMKPSPDFEPKKPESQANRLVMKDLNDTEDAPF